MTVVILLLVHLPAHLVLLPWLMRMKSVGKMHAQPPIIRLSVINPSAVRWLGTRDRSRGSKTHVGTVSGTRHGFRSLEAGSDPEPFRSLDAGSDPKPAEQRHNFHQHTMIWWGLTTTADRRILSSTAEYYYRLPLRLWLLLLIIKYHRTVDIKTTINHVEAPRYPLNEYWTMIFSIDIDNRRWWMSAWRWRRSTSWLVHDPGIPGYGWDRVGIFTYTWQYGGEFWPSHQTLFTVGFHGSAHGQAKQFTLSDTGRISDPWTSSSVVGVECWIHKKSNIFLALFEILKSLASSIARDDA